MKEDTSRGAGRLALERRVNEKIFPSDYYGNDAKPPWYRVKSLSHEQMVSVMEEVCKGRSIQVAARAAGTSLWAIQRQRVADKEFGVAMNEALDLRTLMLEEKAWELAHDGSVETIAKGDVTYERQTYPTAALLQFLLKAYDPEKYGVERKEVRAGPLETPPELIRSEEDRKKLKAFLKDRHAPKEIEAAVEISQFEDLL